MLTAKQYTAINDYIVEYKWNNDMLECKVPNKDISKFLSAFKLNGKMVNVSISDKYVVFKHMEKFLYDFTNMTNDEIKCLFMEENSDETCENKC